MSFGRASIFEHAPEPTTAEYESGPATGWPEWLTELRESLTAPGRYLAYKDERVQTVQLRPGWTRIGRSVTAGVRIDDPTVSRRHALIVWEGEGPLRVLDDRSLNGIVVNGEILDWGELIDGDELTIGRYRLYLIEI